MLGKVEGILPYRNVLVTGGCGFLGGHIVPYLLNRGHKVTVLDDLSTGSLSNIPQEHPNLTFVQGSVLNLELIQNHAHNKDLIIHLASTVGMELVYSKPNESYVISKTGTENMLSTPSHIPIVLFSSSAVYGQTSLSQVAEHQSVTLDDALSYDGDVYGYAVGKWELENLGKLAMKKGRQVMIIRPFNVVGTGQSSAYGMVVPNFIKKALHGNPVTIYDDGNQSRSFTCVETFTYCLYKLMSNQKAWEYPQNIINIGANQSTTINDLAKIVIEEADSYSRIEYKAYSKVFPKKKDVRHRRPDLGLLHELVGEEIEWPDINSIVSRMVAYHARNQVLAV